MGTKEFAYSLRYEIFTFPGLSTTELLRKDLKVVSSSNLTVAISSLPMDLAVSSSLKKEGRN